jgi:hypothetical protein
MTLHVQAPHTLDDLLLGRAPFLPLTLVQVGTQCGQNCMGGGVRIGWRNRTLPLRIAQQLGQDAVYPAVYGELVL